MSVQLRRTVSIKPGVYEELKELSEQTKKPLSAIVEEALQLWFDEQKVTTTPKRKPESSGADRYFVNVDLMVSANSESSAEAKVTEIAKQLQSKKQVTEYLVLSADAA